MLQLSHSTIPHQNFPRHPYYETAVLKYAMLLIMEMRKGGKRRKRVSKEGEVKRVKENEER